jgi:hypothetical protein
MNPAYRSAHAGYDLYASVLERIRDELRARIHAGLLTCCGNRSFAEAPNGDGS